MYEYMEGGKKGGADEYMISNHERGGGGGGGLVGEKTRAKYTQRFLNNYY